MNVVIEVSLHGEALECALFNFLTETEEMGEWVACKAEFYAPEVPVFTINFGVNVDMTFMPVSIGAVGNC
jgi:hypothetical protein